jgi:nicotinamidase-related amidase
MPTSARSALVIIDVINRFDFPEAPGLLRQARLAGPRIATLRRRYHAAGWPVIYANDNHGKWRSNFASVVQACSHEGAPGAWLARLLVPEPQDYFVLKPEQSAFFATPMEGLLRDLKIRRVVLAGLAGDGCVLATALDANMHGFEVRVPSDCCASATRARNDRMLRVLRDSLQISTARGASVPVG